MLSGLYKIKKFEFQMMMFEFKTANMQKKNFQLK